MLLIFKVSYHYHWSFQNVSFSLMEKSTAVSRRFSVKKFWDSIIVFPFFKNSYRPASDMTCFTDIYLRVKRAEHKLSIKYFCHLCKGRLMTQIKSFLNFWNLIGFPPAVLGNIGNESIFKINTTDKSRTFNQYFHVFLFGKIYFWNTWTLAKLWDI